MVVGEYIYLTKKRTNMNDHEIRNRILSHLKDLYDGNPHAIIDLQQLQKELGLSKPELDRNIKYLEDKSTIVGQWNIGGNFRGKITSHGIDILEQQEKSTHGQKSVSMDDKIKTTIKSLEDFKQELNNIQTAAHSSGDDTLGWEKQGRWKERLTHYIKQNISDNESRKCEDLRYPLAMAFDPFQNFDSCINAYNAYLTTLVDEVRSAPDFWLSAAKPAGGNQGFMVPGVESAFSKNKAIFLAHRFEEADLIAKLKDLITANNYNWKEGKREDLGSISEDILNKIKTCGFFLAVMTKNQQLKETNEFTTSSWLIEEKGAALAFGHHPLIMVEEGVARHYIGFLQSDDEMIYFTRENFVAKSQEAIKKIDNTFKKHNVS